MATCYADENFPLPVVEALRSLGHDVLTAVEAGQANQQVPDREVLVFATQAGRALLTHNRRHFIKLHAGGTVAHAGIVACTVDADAHALAARIDYVVRSQSSLSGALLRVNRGP